MRGVDGKTVRYLLELFVVVWCPGANLVMVHNVCFIYIGAAKRGRTKFHAIHEFNEDDYLQICLGNS